MADQKLLFAKCNLKRIGWLPSLDKLGKIKYVLAFLPWFTHCLFLYKLSDQPASHLPQLLFWQQDKLIHMCLFGLLMLWTWRVSCLFLESWSIQAVCSTVFVLLFVLSDEWHQSFVPGRHCSWADACADMIGAVLILILLKPKKPVQSCEVLR